MNEATMDSTRIEIGAARVPARPRPLRSLLHEIAQDGRELAATTAELAKRRGGRAANATAVRLGAGFLAALLVVLALHDLVSGAVDLGLLSPRNIGYSELARGAGTLLVAILIVVGALLATRQHGAAAKSVR